MQVKTVLITGATAGIGFHTALALASRGARVLVTGRDESRGREAIGELRRRAGHDRVELLLADASSIQETRALAIEVSRRTGRLDVLINNVGRVFAERRESVEGLEATLALNFVAPYVLTHELLPLLLESGPARIVNVASSAFAMWKRDPLDDIDSRERYVGVEAHGHAKLLMLLWTLGLARRLEGTSTVANAVNPGMAWTPGTAALTLQAVPQWRFIWPMVRWIQRKASADGAARGPVYLAADADERVSGRYFDGKRERRLPKRLLDAATQDRVWELGMALTSAVRSQRGPAGQSGRSGRA
jgi:NAD(P)-dependent dehydrogenase (short-subunit alcohol dehydrogenase family)